MPREVSRQKTARALRKLERVARQAEAAGTDLTRWEQEFVEGVATRLETYGSAFRDPHKGALEEPLSERQTAIVRVLNRKTRPKLQKNSSSDAGPARQPSRATPKPPKARKPLARRRLPRKSPADTSE